MSFQAYLTNIKAKTGKSPEDFKFLAEKAGLLKPGVKANEIIAWLKKDFDLGYGHAMAIYAVITEAKNPKGSLEDAVSKHFAGAKSAWRKTFDDLLAKLSDFGEIGISTTNTYISLLKKNSKFGIVQITKDRMDIGIKLKKAETTERFAPAGDWNTMVTHRVQITNPEQIDQELLEWLLKAYERT